MVPIKKNAIFLLKVFFPISKKNTTPQNEQKLREIIENWHHLACFIPNFLGKFCLVVFDVDSIDSYYFLMKPNQIAVFRLFISVRNELNSFQDYYRFCTYGFPDGMFFYIFFKTILIECNPFINFDLKADGR